MAKLSRLDIILLISFGIITAIILTVVLIFFFSNVLAFGYNGPDDTGKITLQELLVARTV